MKFNSGEIFFAKRAAMVQMRACNPRGCGDLKEVTPVHHRHGRGGFESRRGHRLSSMNQTPAQRRYAAAAKTRLDYFQRLMTLVSERFSACEDAAFAVRRDEVAKYVAQRLRRPLSVPLRNDVAEVATLLLGFDRTSREGRALYVGVRDVGVSEQNQLEASQTLLAIRRYE